MMFFSQSPSRCTRLDTWIPLICSLGISPCQKKSIYASLVSTSDQKLPPSYVLGHPRGTRYLTNANAYHWHNSVFKGYLLAAAYGSYAVCLLPPLPAVLWTNSDPDLWPMPICPYAHMHIWPNSPPQPSIPYLLCPMPYVPSPISCLLTSPLHLHYISSIEYRVSSISSIRFTWFRWPRRSPWPSPRPCSRRP